MPFSHHSHSGQFCPGHAKNTLEEMIQTAISKHMQVFALTEHMPRHDEDLYPEELEAGVDLNWHFMNEANYFREARRLRQKYESQIEILIGFECEWVREQSLDLIQKSVQAYDFDFVVGSVHHVRTVPIDFSSELYVKARAAAGGSDQRLFEDYFDDQLAMLKALEPPVVGHFDLIRLKSDHPNQSFKYMSTVWEKILRNLDMVASYGGLLELNFASLRKGMNEPYPQAEICEAFLERQGRFCLSDDSHAIDQIALNYHQVLPFLQKCGIKTLFYLTRSPEKQPKPLFPNFAQLQLCSLDVEQLREHRFWLP